MTLKWRLLLLVIFLSGIKGVKAYAQETKITGKVVHAQTNLPVDGVNIQLENSGTGTITNKSGSFGLKIAPGSANTVLVFTHIGFQTQRLTINPGKTDYIVKLTPKAHSLSGVEISAGKKLKPEKIKQETILDYDIIGTRLFVLCWEAGQKNPALQAYQLSSDSLLWSFPLPFYSKELFVDCMQNLHLLTETKFYQVILLTDSIALYPAAPRSDLENYLLPCQAKVENYFYLRRDLNKGVISSFYSVEEETNESKLLQVVKDEVVLTMQTEETRFQFFRNLVDEEAKYINYHMLKIRADRDIEFAQKVMFQAPYVSLLKVGNEACLFDHVHGNIMFFKQDKLVRMLPIDYHLQKGWNSQILADKVLPNAYAVFSKNGILELKHLNLETGNLERIYRLPNPFPVKISVNNGAVYFIYKDPANASRRYLYKASLETLQN